MFGFDQLYLTDGTTTISLLDSPYALPEEGGVDLGLTTLRPSTLGGNGPYAEVDCSILIDIVGSCPANVYTALGQLQTLLGQAQRFWRGDNVAAVKIGVQATGSTVDAVEALILRRNDADAALVLPTVYETNDRGYIMEGIELRFTRRGQWLGATDTASSSATPAGNVFTITLPSHTIPSPTRLDITLPNAGFIGGAANLLLAPLSTDIAVVEAESFGASTDFTVTTPAAAEQARGTQVLTYTPASTSNQTTNTIAAPALLQQQGLFDVFAMVRGGPAIWTIYFQGIVNAGGGGQSLVIHADVDLTGLTNIATSVFLGTIAAPADIGFQTMVMVIRASTIAATLTIDYLVFVKRSQVATAITIGAFSYPTTVYTAGTTMKMVFDPAATTLTTPYAAVMTQANTLAARLGWFGDLFLQTQGSQVAGLILQGRGFNANRYRYTDAADALYNFVVTATRRRAYLTLP